MFKLLRLIRVNTPFDFKINEKGKNLKNKEVRLKKKDAKTL
jgi:hypothetical protein